MAALQQQLKSASINEKYQEKIISELEEKLKQVHLEQEQLTNRHLAERNPEIMKRKSCGSEATDSLLRILPSKKQGRPSNVVKIEAFQTIDQMTVLFIMPSNRQELKNDLVEQPQRRANQAFFVKQGQSISKRESKETICSLLDHDKKADFLSSTDLQIDIYYIL